VVRRTGFERIDVQGNLTRATLQILRVFCFVLDRRRLSNTGSAQQE
jgi:hypothetical protein